MMSTPPPLLVGASLDLSCEIESEGFKLVHEIKWFGPDNTLYVGSSSSNKRTLRVTKVSSIHSGKWTCAVRYGASTLKARTDVIIVGKYRINVTQLPKISSNRILYCVMCFHLRQIKH